MKATIEQVQFVNELINQRIRLREAIKTNTNNFVLAGYAKNNAGSKILYCFCGSGKGYEGAELSPASEAVVVFATKKAAENRLARIPKSYNGFKNSISMEVMPANEYYRLLLDKNQKVYQMIYNAINQ